MLFAKGAKAWGLAYLEKKKKKVTSPLEWEGTHLSTMDAAAWAASGQRRRMKDGSGRVESMLNFDQFRKRSHG